MPSFKNLRQFTTHIVALVLGALLTFGGLQVVSSQTKPIPDLPRDNDTEANAIPAPVAAIPPDINNQSFVAAAVGRTGPAVVRIDTQRTITRRVDPLFDDPFFRDFFGDRFSQTRPQQRQVLTGQGSGFITDKSGVILTNAHVVSKADKVTVTLKDGRQFEGEVRGSDEVTDLAVVKINPKGENLPIAPLGDSANVSVGDWAIAVGNPVGLNNTVTLGIISTLSRSSAQVGIPDKRVDFLQTDAAINPGNSGGPLLNAQGEVIGINTAIRADAMGIGFAIPINKAKTLEATLASGKKVAHPYVGIQMVTLTPDLAKQNNDDPNSPFFIPEIEGVLVVRVLENTPAAKAGVRRGDVIIKVNDKKITDAGELQTIVENTGIDRTIKFTLQRGQQELNLDVQTAQLENISFNEQ